MNASTHCCEQMMQAVEDPQVPLSYLIKYREYGIDILDGGSSMLVISYCPWCGARLPESLRDAWFDKLEALGIDPYEDAIPEIFEDDRWYKEAAK